VLEEGRLTSSVAGSMRFKTCRFSWFAAFWSSTSGVVGMVPASLLPLCSRWHGRCTRRWDWCTISGHTEQELVR